MQFGHSERTAVTTPELDVERGKVQYRDQCLGGGLT